MKRLIARAQLRLAKIKHSLLLNEIAATNLELEEAILDSDEDVQTAMREHLHNLLTEQNRLAIRVHALQSQIK